MPTATVTERGQVTFRKDLLQHLGITSGEKIEITKLPHGRLEVRSVKPTGTIDDFIGRLKGKSPVKLTLEEIEQAIQDGWAGRR